MELWELVARESIRDLIARYNANGDSGRIDQMVDVFAPDATFESGGEVQRGRDEIHAFFSGVAGNARARSTPEHAGEPGAAPSPVDAWIARGRAPFIRHVTGTTQIDVESETVARARSYYMVIAVHGLDHWGRYLDEFGIVDGDWRITHRREITDAVLEGGWGAQSGGELVADVVTRGLTWGEAR